MEPVTLIAVLVVSQTPPVITEVASNPLDDTTGEFVEIHNPGPDTLALDGWSLTDGDALDYLEAWDESSHGTFPHPEGVTGTDTLLPGGFCLVFELDYPDDPVYDIADGTLIMTTGDHAICNGLAASSDPLTLFDPGGTADSNAVSTYGTPVPSDSWEERDDDGLDSIPFDPGEGYTVERYPLTAPDQEGSWFRGPFGGSPGSPTEPPPDTVNVSCVGIWTDSPDPPGGEPFSIHAAFLCWGTVPPSSGELYLFLDAWGDSIPQQSEILGSWPAADLQPGVTDTFSVQVTLETGWYIPSALADVPEDGCPEDDYDRMPLAVGGGVPAVITEVVANALNETTDEMIEVYYPGPGALLLAGCHITDGDALDVLQAWEGGGITDPDALALPALPGGRVGLILDSDYPQGTQPYQLPESTVVVTTDDKTLGNGLTTNDPVLLYHHADSSLSSLMSTYGTPILSDDPLGCDDDGADGIPFDPGDGCGVQRISPLLPDAEWTWESSGYGATPGWVPYPQHDCDLAVVSMDASPANPDPYEPLTLSALALNAGLEEVSGGKVIFFDDQDNDSLPGSGEVLEEVDLPPLAPGDTLTVQTVATRPEGNYLMAALSSHPDDPDGSNDLGRIGVVVGDGGDVVVSEVVCTPEDQACDEMIELYYPGPGVFDLTGCRFTDGDAVDSLVAMEPGSVSDPDAAYGSYLPEGCFALILDKDYPDGEQPYDLPPGTLVLTVTNAALGNGLTGSDPITLYGPGGTTNDFVMSTYGTPVPDDDPLERDDDGLDGIPFDPGTGGSVQRIDLEGPDREDNWFSSSEGPTPGGPPPEVYTGPDAAVTLLTADPPMGAPESQVTLTSFLTSAGTEPIGQGDLVLALYEDADGDSLAEPSEEIFSWTAGAMSPGDSIQIPAQWTAADAPALLLAVSHCQADTNPANDTARVIWNRPYSLVINEIMYSPAPGRPEWVELHVCPGTGPVDLAEVRFSDSRDTTSVTEASILLQPGDYAVLCSDSTAFWEAWPDVEAPVIQPQTWPTLNNTNQQGQSWADDLRLSLASGQVIDRVPYGDDWGGDTGRSLERIEAPAPGWEASNWTGCAEGGTPGGPNSASSGQQGGPFLAVWPSPFSPDGDGHDDVLNISMNAETSGNTVTARIYNVQGRVVKTLTERMECGSSLALQWDGSDENGARMPVGRYIVFLRCRPASGEVREAVEVVILARRL
ncbi:MAG: lamin tail domain-containing protein [Candidatus Fermentibacteraceae bacterium]